MRRNSQLPFQLSEAFLDLTEELIRLPYRPDRPSRRIGGSPARVASPTSSLFDVNIVPPSMSDLVSLRVAAWHDSLVDLDGS